MTVSVSFIIVAMTTICVHVENYRILYMITIMIAVFVPAQKYF